MKKLILSIAILAVMTFAACSEEEKDYTPHYTMCQHCDIPEEEGYEVCTGDNGNAYVGNADTGIELVRYFQLFCDNEPDTGPVTYSECVTCISDEAPEGTKVCKGSNGRAYTFVGNVGTDTGIPMAEYIAANCTSTVPIAPEPVTLTNCVTCEAMGIEFGEVCKGSNGHAYLDEVDTGANYSQYINTFEMTGGSCD